MIPFIRSLSELIAITESREISTNILKKDEKCCSRVERGEGKKYIRRLEKKEVYLPNLPKTIRRKWMQNKKSVSKFIDGLDYNNQIQSSYDLTLLGRQYKKNQQDVA